jgi:hypothetical protein
MRKIFLDWWFHPAEPWEFWYPQSGIIGGLIAAIMITSVIVGGLTMLLTLVAFGAGCWLVTRKRCWLLGHDWEPITDRETILEELARAEIFYRAGQGFPVRFCRCSRCSLRA